MAAPNANAVLFFLLCALALIFCTVACAESEETGSPTIIKWNNKVRAFLYQAALKPRGAAAIVLRRTSCPH